MKNLLNLVPVGQTVVTFNKWNEFQNQQIDDCFTPFSEEDMKSLKGGDLIWINQEPYHHHGKVYGYTLEKLTEVKPTEGGIKIYYPTGMTTLYFNRPSGKNCKVLPEDEEKLVALIEENSPKCFSLGYN